MNGEESIITREAWGNSDGQSVYLFRMTNSRGAFVDITNYGATLVSVAVPDKTGRIENVILGFPTLEGYKTDVCCMGSTIGRFANRIGGAAFSLDGTTYSLDRNDGNNTNHGGTSGFHKRVFDAEINGKQLVLTLKSADGDGGFPGNLTLRVTYGWNDDHELNIRHTAVTDKTTVASFTNHAYFNLTAGRGDIAKHRLTVTSDERIEIDAEYIPTGKILSTGNLTFNGQQVSEKFTEEKGHTQGLNTYYLFPTDRIVARPIGTLSEDTSGRIITVLTSYPGVQVYTGDFLSSAMPGNYGRRQQPFDGICLECQFPPDSPNHKNFPSTRLDPGQVFDEHIIYKFSLNNGV